jgi:hypothetical protein
MSIADQSKRLAEITNDIWRKIDFYVTAALYIVAAIVPVLIIPSVPTGGALVLPIFVGLVMAVLHVRGHPTLAKLLFTYYMIFVILMQVFPLATNPNIIKISSDFGLLEALLIVLGLVLLPMLFLPFSGLAVAGGFLAGSLMVDPRFVPVGFAILIVLSIYQRKLAGPAGMFLVALLAMQPFVVAASIVNKAILAFPSMSIEYIRLIPSTNKPFPVYLVKGLLPNPIYLLAPSTSLGQMFYAIGGFVNNLLNPLATEGFKKLLQVLASITQFYVMQVLMAVVFSVVSIVSVEGISLLRTYFQNPDRGELSKYFATLEPLVFSLLLSLLFIYFASMMGVPLGYKTAIGFSAGFAPLALGSVVVGGAAISAEELYINRRAEEILLREDIERIAKELRTLEEDIRKDLGLIRESVREREFPYDEPLAQIEKDMTGILSAAEDGGLENLRRLRASAGELLTQAQQLRNRMIAEILDYARTVSLRFNSLTRRYAELTGRTQPASLPVDYSSISDVAQVLRGTYDTYKSLSNDMISLYKSVAGALHRLFPNEVPVPEEAEPTESLDRLEALLNYFLVPLLEGRRELFESFRDKVCNELSVGCGIPIIEAPKLVEELQRWAEEKASELEERRNAVMSLRSTFSDIVKFEHGYSSLIESEKVLPKIENVIESLRGWSDGESILAAAAAYRELVPQIEKAIKEDRIRVNVLCNYRLMEQMIIDMMDQRNELRAEDIPLSADAAAYLMKVIATLRPGEFAYEEKVMPFSEVRRVLRRRK